MKLNKLILQSYGMSRRHGLTLIEVLVAASILTMVFGVSFGAMRIYDISISMGSQKSNLSAQANLALNKMMEKLALSRHSQIVPAITTMTEKSGGAPPSNQIIFRIPTSGLDAQQNIQWGDGIAVTSLPLDDRTITYSVNSSNQLIETRTTNGQQTVLANNITGLQLTESDSENYLVLEVTAAKLAQRGVVPGVSVTVSSRVCFRN